VGKTAILLHWFLSANENAFPCLFRREMAQHMQIVHFRKLLFYIILAMDYKDCANFASQFAKKRKQQIGKYDFRKHLRKSILWHKNCTINC